MAETDKNTQVNPQPLNESGIKKVLVMIPAYNEATNIVEVIKGIRSNVPEADILVINDGSKDDTANISRQAGVHVISHPFNMGYGVTCQTGFKYASRKGYDYVVQMDGDGQHDPTCIPAMLKTLQESNVDVVLGSRWLGLTKYKGPLLRKFGKFIFGFIASLITKHKVTDPTTGFQAFTKQVVQFYCTEVYPVDYPDADMIIVLDRAEFRVKEVPVIMYNKTGQSMHSGFIKPIYYGMKMMMSIGMSLFRDDRSFVQQYSQTPHHSDHDSIEDPVAQTKENHRMQITK
jgi:glycosyltransferase involved in cell wall biosynthesis